MGDADSGLGLVDVLAARAGGAVDVDAQILGLDVHVHVLGFGHNGHGGCGSVDAALCLGGRHTLYAVGAGFKLQVAVNPVAGDEADDFLVPAGFRGRLAHDLDLPALELGVAGIHAEEVGREESGFLAARTGADFQHGVLLVQGILGDELDFELPF